MRALGIEDTLFPLSFDRIVFYGFSISFGMSLVTVIYIFMIALPAFLWAPAIKAAASSNTASTLKRYFLDRITTESKSLATHGLLWKFFSITGCVLLAYLIFFCFLLLFIKSGEFRAVAFLKKVNDGEAIVQEIWIQSNTQPIIGTPIVCNTSACAFRTKSGTMVINLGQVTKIVTLERRH